MNKFNFNTVINIIKLGGSLNILIISNVLIFIISLIINLILNLFNLNNIDIIFGLNSNFFYFLIKPWSLVSYSFFHDGFIHLFFNMLILNFSGKRVINYFSSKTFFNLYFLGIIISGIFFLLGTNLFPFFYNKNILLLGSSSAVYTILWTWIFHSHNDYVKLFFTTYIKIWQLGVIIFLYSIITLSDSQNYGGLLSHLGGIFTAYIFIYYNKKNIDITMPISKFFNIIYSIFKNKKNKSFNLKDDIEFNEYKKSNQKEVDTILEKIAKNGYESLSKKEKDILFKKPE